VASKQPNPEVILADEAIDQLDGIWHWNVTKYGLEHANSQVALPKRLINALDLTW